MKTLGLFFSKTKINQPRDRNEILKRKHSVECTDQKYLRDQRTSDFRRVDLDVKLATKKVPIHKGMFVFVC